MEGSTKIKIYIGTPIQYESERIAVNIILQKLKKENVEAVLLINFNIKTTQIDIVLIVKGFLYVFEVKGSLLPLRGTTNSDWEKQSSNGDWIRIRNYYNQALNASYVIKDAFLQSNYPEAVLLFVPGLPLNSVIPDSDFKVKSINISDLQSFHFSGKTGNINSSDIENFVRKHGLTSVSENSLMDSKLLEANQQLSNYCESFSRSYSSELVKVIPTECKIGNDVVSAVRLQDYLFNGNWLITGKSGYGKSILAKQIALDYVKKGVAVVYLEAIFFDGIFKTLFDQEVALLGFNSAKTLINVTERLNAELIIIIDGYNECPEINRKRLGRCLLALSRRYTIRIIVVTQNTPEELVNLDLKSIEVFAPSIEVKKAIAGLYAGSDIISKLEPLLKAVSTSMEANIVGEIASDNVSSASRFTLFDYYVRKKLSNRVDEGIKILILIANWLTQRTTFTISLRESQRICEQHQISSGIIDYLIDQNLLKKSFDKISYSHELFLNTYISENLIQNANAQEILTSLNEPANYDRQDFILGAIEDFTLLSEVLYGISSDSIVKHLMDGSCGLFAKQWAYLRYEEIFKFIDIEASNIEFEIIEDALRPVKIKADSLRSWTDQELAFIYAIPYFLRQGYFIEKFCTSISIADESINKYFKTLVEEAKAKGIGLRSNLFMTAYIPLSQSIFAVGSIISGIQSGINALDDDKINIELQQVLKKTTLGNGQLFFLLQLARFSDLNKLFYPVIESHLTNKLKYIPHHLRLQLFDSIPYCWSTEEQRERLITLINTLPDETNAFVASHITETLLALGAMEEDELNHHEVVKQEIQTVLDSPDFKETWLTANYIYTSQFDHPFDSAYYQVISSLEPEKKNKLIEAALKGAAEKETGDFFITSLIIEASKALGKNVEHLLDRWKVVPDLNSGLVDEARDSFFVTYVILGFYGISINNVLSEENRPIDNALYACANILYWINRKDVNETEQIKACSKAWAILNRHELGASVDSLWTTLTSLRWRSNYIYDELKMIQISEVFPNEIAEVCRQALRMPELQISVSKWGKTDIVGRAINLLGQFGSIVDLPLLRTLSNEKQHGVMAIEAIKVIESKII